ncbi:Regulator of protease activity HflC, stomatin/prohibitin superfamily [Chitinophaga sp. YR573]|uniref:SPFH domain-containing protein n=1 Tax=Chitinophaga sp. YR573 TaxID=1881040 RepID=UPI0008BD6B51|nr:SPFH domain-containing protein [Chitinophaga sp. YR573]SEW23100.1 Regulator of protease activity HflC, stomatin/prohibitin superfamily [Chitinophaga sp. YR573]
MEKILKPFSGFLALIVAIIALPLAVYMFTLMSMTGELSFIWLAILLFIVFIFAVKGIMIVNPNHARVLTFFGKYTGSVKENGLLWVNPLYKSASLSLRSQNLNGQQLKVNDKLGNPIEIAAVIVWRVSDTYKASFEVSNFQQYVNVQSEAAVRHLAVSYAYDIMEDESADITLRDGGDKVNEMLEKELNDRLAPAGISVLEARISHLAYAPEIAGAMLQRQQATAIVAARSKIVEGAVGMVEMALARLSEKQIIILDEERKAAMVSNLLVVLCGDSKVTPVVNTGTLHQ